jgi:hypothetical protein
MMQNLFDYILNKLEVALLVRPSNPSGAPTGGGAGNTGAGSSAAAAASGAGGATGTDGICAIAMLSVLTEFEHGYREAKVVQITNHLEELQLHQQHQQQQNAAGGGSGSGGGGSNALMSAAAMAAAAAGVGIRERVTRFNLIAMDDETTEAHLAAMRAADEYALGLYLNSYLSRSMETTRLALLHKINMFTNDQIKWIRAQKADPRSADVLAPFTSFPTFVSVVVEMCNGMVRATSFYFQHSSFCAICSCCFVMFS